MEHWKKHPAQGGWKDPRECDISIELGKRGSWGGEGCWGQGNRSLERNDCIGWEFQVFSAVGKSVGKRMINLEASVIPSLWMMRSL